MCDYCGCRQQAAIDELTDEHEVLLELVHHMRRFAARDDLAACRTLLRDRLLPLLSLHTDKEERGVITALRGGWEADTRLDTLVDEHRQAEQLVALTAAGDPGWSQAATELVDLLTEHIFAEETDLFPYALYELDHRQWETIERIHAAARGARHPEPSSRLILRRPSASGQQPGDPGAIIRASASRTGRSMPMRRPSRR